MKIPIQAIPTYKGNEKTHSDMADNKDIRRAIFSCMPEAIAQTKDFAKYFKRNSARETCKCIFDFLKNEISYVADGDLQLIKLPSALLHTKVGDCKSYSVLTAAILYNLGIPCHFVLVSFNTDPTPSHIFVETTDGCIIDAVWGIFDDEKKPTYRYEVSINGKMKVKSISGVGQTFLSGCGCGCGCNACKMTGISGRAERKQRRQEKKEDRKERRQERRETRGTTAARVGLVAGRNLFLVIVKANLDGIASKLAKMDFSKISKAWLKAGGKPQNLQKAISIGSQKRAKKLGLLGMLAKRGKKVNGISGGIFDENTLEVVIPPIATSVGTAVNPVAGTAAGASLGAVLVKLIPIIVEVLQMVAPSEVTDAILNQTLGSEDLANEDSNESTQTFEDYTNEMTKAFDPNSSVKMTDAELIEIYKISDDLRKGYWKKLQAQFGRPKKDNTITYVLLGIAAIGGVYFLTKKK